MPRPLPPPRAPASPTATSPPCWLRRRRAPACWRWRRSRPRSAACLSSPPASRSSARSACSGGAMRWTRLGRAARTGIARSPTRCAPRPSGTTSAARRCCSSMIDARSPATSAARCLADDAALRDYLWKSEGALFALAARIVAPAAPAQEIGRCRGGVRPRLRSGAPAAGVAASAVARAHAAAAIAARAGRGRPEDLLAGDAGVERCRPARRPARRVPRRTLSRAGNMWRICRARLAPLSFLWPWSSPICGHWNGRAAICCAARPRSRRCVRVCRIAMAHWLGRM